MAITTPVPDGITIASDTVEGKEYQKFKPAFGADGSATDVSTANPLPVTVGLTDTQLRASAVPVAVDFPTTQPVSGNVGVTGSVAVTGTFWQATQPISAAALPLPTGAATSARQDTNTAAINKLGSAKRWFPITPDGNTDLTTIPDAVYVGGAGDVVLKGSDGTNATFAATAGQVLPFSPTRVLATGTTATGLVGLVS